MRLPVNHALPLVLIAGLAGGAGAFAKDRPAAPGPATGPAADYPVVVGPAFQVGSTTYTPDDRLNYDAVGYADIAQAGGTTISGAHKTLPLPSYVEVTSLESGKTILLRVERRGPLNDQLIELSPGAAAQLGLAGATKPAVRVRRVNPPEQERAMLRAGGNAPMRMETPKGLLDALNRKLNAGVAILSPKPVALPGGPVASTAAPSPAATPNAAPRTAPKPAAVAKLVPAPAPTAAPTTSPPLTAKPTPTAPQPVAPPAPKPTASNPATAPASTTAAAPAPHAAAAQGLLVVQVGAFSVQASATSVASKLGGQTSTAGRLWRVRLGPFASHAEAEAALAKAKGAGYSDARIQRAD